MTTVNINVKGLDKVKTSLGKLTNEIPKIMPAMNSQIEKEVLMTVGLKAYPGETDANKPPTPYYIRGTGMQYKSGNSGGSENLKEQWEISNPNTFSIRLANTATYAPYVHGDQNQAHWMKAIGWRKLAEVTMEKLDRITKIVEGYVKILITRVGL